MRNEARSSMSSFLCWSPWNKCRPQNAGARFLHHSLPRTAAASSQGTKISKAKDHPERAASIPGDMDRSDGVRSDQIQFLGDQDRMYTVARAEFVEHGPNMVLDGSQTNVELLSDVLIRVSRSH